MNLKVWFNIKAVFDEPTIAEVMRYQEMISRRNEKRAIALNSDWHVFTCEQRWLSEYTNGQAIEREEPVCPQCTIPEL